MIEIKNYNDLRLNLDLLPPSVALDVMCRICDWLSSGGCLDDNYVKTQLEYANNIIETKL